MENHVLDVVCHVDYQILIHAADGHVDTDHGVVVHYVDVEFETIDMMIVGQDTDDCYVDTADEN